METTKGQHRGVRCGNCSTREHPVYHENAAAVKDCYALRYDEEAQAEAEMLAEQRAERYWEEGTPAQQAARWAEEEEERRHLGGFL